MFSITETRLLHCGSKCDSLRSKKTKPIFSGLRWHVNLSLQEEDALSLKFNAIFHYTATDLSATRRRLESVELHFPQLL